MFGVDERSRRGSLLNPIHGDKADWMHVVAALTAEIDNYQHQTIEYNNIQSKQSNINEYENCWKRTRLRKNRYKRAGGKYNAETKLENTDYQIPKDMSTVTAVFQNVLKFRELLKLKKILSEQLFDRLREQFRMIDSDRSGYITRQKAFRINMLLAPHVSLDEIHQDVNILFDYVDADYVSELQWLRSWANSVIQQNYDLQHVQEFIESFDYMNENTDFEAILSSDYVSQIGLNVFSKMMKWKLRAMSIAEIKQQQLIAQQEMEKRKQEEKEKRIQRVTKKIFVWK